MGTSHLVAALLALLPVLSSAHGETIRFPSATWPPTPLQQRLAKAPGQTIAERAGVEIAGELYRPPDKGQHPVIVLMPPCDGRLPLVAERAEGERYTGLGYGLLAVDSFGPRGITDGCSGAGSSIDLVMDAYGALLRLAELPSVDRARVAIVGFSRGGDAALTAVEFDGAGRLFDPQFRAAVAYYPFCQREEAMAVAVPTLILSGESDDWNLIRDCRALVAKRRPYGAPLRLMGLAGAQHGFNLDLPARRLYGHRLEYDAHAAAAAWRETVSLLRQAFAR
jgi:dienelactone hydrolase